jgi:hypothetical protein
MSNTSPGKPGEDEFFKKHQRGFSDTTNTEQNASKLAGTDGRSTRKIDPLKQKSKENIDPKRKWSEGTDSSDIQQLSDIQDQSTSKRRRLESRESSNGDIQDQLNRARLDRPKKELGSTTDVPKSKVFEDIQHRLSANRARLDRMKKADSGYSDEFHKDAGILFKLGKEAKMGLKHIEKYKELPPPPAED